MSLTLDIAGTTIIKSSHSRFCYPFVICNKHSNEVSNISCCKQVRNNFSYESVKRIIKRNTNSKYFHSVKQKIQGKNWEQIYYDPNIIPELPCKSAVAKFRLITGHDCQSKHLHKIGVFTSAS